MTAVSYAIDGLIVELYFVYIDGRFHSYILVENIVQRNSVWLRFRCNDKVLTTSGTRPLQRRYPSQVPMYFSYIFTAQNGPSNPCAHLHAPSRQTPLFLQIISLQGSLVQALNTILDASIMNRIPVDKISVILLILL
jgi:hypothetical protein